MELSFIPNRGEKPRTNGVTMVMDKGLYSCQVEGLCQLSSGVVDFVKLGFGTSLFTQNLDQKLAAYRQHGIEVYPGGTLFEAFYIRGEVDKYEEFLKAHNFTTLEISDGSIKMDHEAKCEMIQHFSKNYTVLSEVGSKIAGAEISNENWTKMMAQELEAGSKFVIAEAREAGNVGIFDSKGCAREDMINQIVETVSFDKIIWEAPAKNQQVWFVKRFGANVNLGNIAAEEILSLETIRNGLRGDTFGLHLPDDMKLSVQ